MSEKQAQYFYMGVWWRPHDTACTRCRLRVYFHRQTTTNAIRIKITKWRKRCAEQMYQEIAEREQW